MNYLTIKSRFLSAVLLCLLFQIGFSSDPGDGTLIVREYYRLLNVAIDGDAGDKVSLFLYATKHPKELERYADPVLQHLVEASDGGHGEASFWLGRISEKGIWMARSDHAALTFYVLSAQQGFDKGMHASVLYFAKAAVAATSEEERESALFNAQKWYDALADIRGDSKSIFESARFNYAVGRLKIDPIDEYGMKLLSEAAIEGHATAASIIREFYAEASSSNFEGDPFSARVVERWKSTVEIIGASDKGGE